MTPIATADHLISVYLVYATASIGLTIWLARTLFKNGEVFLEDVFADNPRMAASVNQLLVVGFYLLNLGYALITLKAGHEVSTSTEALETLAMKLGSLLLSLGALHMGNLYHLFHPDPSPRTDPPRPRRLSLPQMRHDGYAARRATSLDLRPPSPGAPRHGHHHLDRGAGGARRRSACRRRRALARPPSLSCSIRPARSASAAGAGCSARRASSR